MAGHRMIGRTLAFASILLLTIAFSAPAIAQEDADPVQGVFFFSPTCGHCEYVIMEVLPGVFETYGGSPEILFDGTIPEDEIAFYKMSNGTVELLLVDATKYSGSALYEADAEIQEIPDEMLGVPRLTMDNGYWVGSVDIPEMLPILIERGLAEGGMPYPDIPGLDQALDTIPQASGPSDGTTTTTVADASDGGTTTSTTAVDPFDGGDQSVWDTFSEDPVGNSISVVVLLAMAATLVIIAVRLVSGAEWGTVGWPIPILALIGLVIAGYLGIVEASGSDAVCGPVGDCNTVQQSEYAEIFGIPIGIIGMAGYAAILIAWGVARMGGGTVADLAVAAMATVAVGGTCFSMYLTFLEPFVIGATCMWCITSALIITTLAFLTAQPGWSAAKRLFG